MIQMSPDTTLVHSIYRNSLGHLFARDGFLIVALISTTFSKKMIYYACSEQ